MRQDRTSVFVYTIAQDTGFAPNPFHSVCSLATCKPDVRKAAKPGDFIIGKAGAPRGTTAVFVMEVNEIMTFDEYWREPQFECKKPRRNGDPMCACGDNIYHRSPDGGWGQAPSFHGVHDIARDTGTTDRVLLSRNFTYFGAEGPDLPELHDTLLKPGIRRVWRNFKDRDRRELDAWICSLNGQGRIAMPTDFREQGGDKGCGPVRSGCTVICN
ncbi:MAG: hypothetical protein OXC13_01020 [Caldilineaceae bacterium]|nr:hypothetical protein [Caldilineaceae bacterium]